MKSKTLTTTCQLPVMLCRMQFTDIKIRKFWALQTRAMGM